MNPDTDTRTVHVLTFATASGRRVSVQATSDDGFSTIEIVSGSLLDLSGEDLAYLAEWLGE